MVRTLVFHSNNVGSIPAGPSINSLQTIKNIKRNDYNTKFNYEFAFASTISISNHIDFKLKKFNFYRKDKKLHIKRSYLLLT